MHADEVDIDVDLVRRLVTDQFPALGDLEIRPIESMGTVNAMYRLGDDLCVRLPRTEAWAGGVLREWHWLPKLAARLTLEVPRPIAKGRPAASFPFEWAIYGWIEGQTYADAPVEDERQAAIDLAEFVIELRGVPPTGAPPAGRSPLSQLDAATREAIDASGDLIDTDAALAVWKRAVREPAWDGSPVWIHADLLRSNLLVRDGRLRAVLDFGGAGIGDPAADVIAAWAVFSHVGREAFRERLDVDDATWRRARAFALQQAAFIIPYYRVTNPAFVSLARRTVGEIVVEGGK
jgi:aminoglycoside phosphotransferase (APT) family kinase protein